MKSWQCQIEEEDEADATSCKTLLGDDEAFQTCGEEKRGMCGNRMTRSHSPWTMERDWSLCPWSGGECFVR
jgi:hypothetical protein